MSNRRTGAGRCTTLVALAVAAFAATAAAPAQAAPAPKSDLGFTVFHGDDIRTHSLQCSPDGGAHPDARTACGQLRKAHGNLLTLGPGSDPSCNAPDTDPVNVEIMGMWKGKITVFNPHYPNPECAQASAGLVVPIH